MQPAPFIPLRFFCAALCLLASAGWAAAQGPRPAAASPQPAPASPPIIVPLVVPAGMPIQVALDKEVRVRQAGQPLHGRVVQPIYAFDQLVVPVGTQVIGKILKKEDVSGKQRTLSALNADFTPSHKLDVEFDELILPSGKHVPVHVTVTPGSGQMIELVSAGAGEKKKTPKDAAAKKIAEAKQQASRQWQDTMKQVKAPGKIHRIERYAIGQLPARPQYLDSGTLYLAELQQPLDFGAEHLTADAASSIGSPPPPGSLVHALLVTPLNSATTQKGAEVEAILSQPLFDGHKLILPQGSRLRGSVLAVQPARHWSHNGQLRIVFHELIPPSGLAQRVDASLEGLQAGQQDHVHLDSEGGAQATSPKTRYLTSGIAIALAAASSGGPDGERGVNNAGANAGDASGRAAGGAAGFKLIGIALGILVHSQPVGMAMGVYGASQSVYSHFIARGHEVVFPKNTGMEIGIGGRVTPQPQGSPAQSAPAPPPAAPHQAAPPLPAQALKR